MAVPFDVERIQVKGPAVAVVENVRESGMALRGIRPFSSGVARLRSRSGRSASGPTPADVGQSQRDRTVLGRPCARLPGTAGFPDGGR